MSYTVLNANVFTAAFSGATSGMGVSGRVIVNPDPNHYSGLISIADAFAQEFDTLWGGSSIGYLELEIIFLATEALWQERAPVPSTKNLTPATWQSECEAIIALIDEALDFYAANGYPNPPIGTGGGAIVPLIDVRYVDPDTIGVTQDGSIANPFSNIQQAFDSLNGIGFTEGTIIVCPSSANPIGGGNLTIPISVGFELAIRGEGGSARSTEDNGSSDGYGTVARIGGIQLDPGSTNVILNMDSITFVVTGGSSGGIDAPGGGEGGPNPSTGALGFTNCQVGSDINATSMRVLSQGTSFLGDLDVTKIEAYDTTPSLNNANTWAADTIFVDSSTDFNLTANAANATPRTVMANTTSLFETSGPTTLPIQAIPDQTFLKRVGGNIVGVANPSTAVTTATFVQPTLNGVVNVPVDSINFFTVHQMVVVDTAFSYYEVTTINPTSVDLRLVSKLNPGGLPEGSVVAIGANVAPSGLPDVSEVVSINVPALVAGVLAYLTVDLTAQLTVVKGINAGDQVILTPQSDLVAAGATNGFYIGAHVTALNTVRLTFVGTLPGGAANFLITYLPK